MRKKLSSSSESHLTVKTARDVIVRIKMLEGLSPHTIANYNKLFNDFERCYAPNKRMDNFSVEDARRFVDWQLNEKVQFKNSKFRPDKKIGVNARSVNSYLRMARAAFNTLIAEGHIENNPFTNVKDVKQKSKPKEILTEAEIAKLLRSFDRSWYADFRAYVLVHTLLDTFGRITETLSLRKDDVDLDGCVVTFTETKSSLYRVVPISKKTARLIRQLIDECKEFDTDYIFLTNAGKPLTGGSARKHLSEAVKRAGMDRPVTPHLFRHSSATIFLKNGGDVAVLQKILGHSDIRTTLIYAQVLDETMRTQHAAYAPMNHISERQRIKAKTSLPGTGRKSRRKSK